MNAPLVFMDTETTGLSLDDDIWEFAAIRRDPDGAETETHVFIEHSREKCERLPQSFYDDHTGRYLDHRAVRPRDATEIIFPIFREKAHVVGAVPNFDTERLRLLFAKWWPHWPTHTPWHYHLIDIENLAVGFLAGRASQGDLDAGLSLPDLPWDSNDLSRAVGVDPEQFPRHTAMGDVRWAMAIYDAVMGGAS